MGMTRSAALVFAAIIATAGPPPTYCMSQLIASGVLDRFPSMRIYFAETNAGWMPWGLWKWDDNYKLFHEWFGVNLKMLPSEYLRKHFLFSIVRDPISCPRCVRCSSPTHATGAGRSA